jgi:hypothetical protein
MGKHLRKLFSADQVKEEFRRYLAPADRSRSSIGNAQDSKAAVLQVVETLPGQAREFFFAVHL